MYITLIATQEGDTLRIRGNVAVPTSGYSLEVCVLGVEHDICVFLAKLCKPDTPPEEAVEEDFNVSIDQPLKGLARYDGQRLRTFSGYIAIEVEGSESLKMKFWADKEIRHC